MSIQFRRITLQPILIPEHTVALVDDLVGLELLLYQTVALIDRRYVILLPLHFIGYAAVLSRFKRPFIIAELLWPCILLQLLLSVPVIGPSHHARMDLGLQLGLWLLLPVAHRVGPRLSRRLILCLLLLRVEQLLIKLVGAGHLLNELWVRSGRPHPVDGDVVRVDRVVYVRDVLRALWVLVLPRLLL